MTDAERTKALTETVAYLAEQEWAAWRSSDGGREDVIGGECCPECAGMKEEGHAHLCRLDVTLAAARTAVPELLERIAAVEALAVEFQRKSDGPPIKSTDMDAGSRAAFAECAHHLRLALGSSAAGGGT